MEGGGGGVPRRGGWLINSVPPQQRWIGLWRLKSCVRARIALPSAVSFSLLFLYRARRSRSSCISSVNGPSSRPATAGARQSAGRSPKPPPPPKPHPTTFFSFPFPPNPSHSPPLPTL